MKNKGNINAQKHGLLSKQLVISHEDSRAFNKFTKQLMAELNPESALESLLAEQIVINYWRLKRFLKLENEVFLFAGEPKWNLDKDFGFIKLFTEFVNSNPSFDLLSRYNASILRSFYRSINEYESLKSSKKLDK